MKNLTLIGAVGITVIILIIAFQNFASQAAVYMFFNLKSTPLTLPLLFMSILGMVAGSLYTIFIQSATKKEEKEENGEEF
jgi:uncharacterized integral membrane protein